MGFQKFFRIQFEPVFGKTEFYFGITRDDYSKVSNLETETKWDNKSLKKHNSNFDIGLGG